MMGETLLWVVAWLAVAPMPGVKPPAGGFAERALSIEQGQLRSLGQPDHVFSGFVANQLPPDDRGDWHMVVYLNPRDRESKLLLRDLNQHPALRTIKDWCKFESYVVGSAPSVRDRMRAAGLTDADLPVLSVFAHPDHPLFGKPSGHWGYVYRRSGYGGDAAMLARDIYRGLVNEYRSRNVHGQCPGPYCPNPNQPDAPYDPNPWSPDTRPWQPDSPTPTRPWQPPDLAPIAPPAPLDSGLGGWTLWEALGVLAAIAVGFMLLVGLIVAVFWMGRRSGHRAMQGRQAAKLGLLLVMLVLGGTTAALASDAPDAAPAAVERLDDGGTAEQLPEPVRHPDTSPDFARGVMRVHIEGWVFESLEAIVRTLRMLRLALLLGLVMLALSLLLNAVALFRQRCRFRELAPREPPHEDRTLET